MAAAPDDELALIPRAVRDKLDRIGIKLHLDEWTKFTPSERRQLVDRPCATAADAARYGDELVALIRARTGRDPDRLPPR